MKGHVCIELHNHNSGFTERIEQDNMVTNALTYAMGHAVSCGANLSDLMLPVCKRGLGGLFLFDGKLEENAENVHFPMNVHLIGHASRTVNTDDPMRGSINALETKRTDTGYVSVWDFSTSQANGTIASLALTRDTAGEDPLKLYAGESGNTTDYEYGLAFDEDKGFLYKADRYGNIIRQKVPDWKLLVSDPYWGPDEKVVNLSGTDNWDNWIISNGQDGYLYMIRMNRRESSRWNGSEYENYYTYGMENSSGNALLFVRKYKISDFSFTQEGDEQTIKDKKNFTVEQIMDIADLFHISVDSLLGRKGEVSGTLTPRSIARFLVQLIEDNDAEIFDYEKEEETFEYDDNQYPPSVDHEKKVIKYPALYLPNYWYIPYDADPIKEQELYSEMTQVGNETSMIPVNNFLRHFREIFTIYKKGDLSEEAYKSVVEDMLSRLRD